MKLFKNNRIDGEYELKGSDLIAKFENWLTNHAHIYAKIERKAVAEWLSRIGCRNALALFVGANEYGGGLQSTCEQGEIEKAYSYIGRWFWLYIEGEELKNKESFFDIPK